MGTLFREVKLIILWSSLSVVTWACSTHPFYWKKLDVDLQLVESGDLLVTETQQYIFTDRDKNQRYRYIQIDKIDKIKDITVTENDRPVSNLQVSRSNDRQYIKWEHNFASNFPGSHVFVLRYRAIGSLEVEKSQTNLKWMAIFPDRQAPINSAQVTLHLPAKLAGMTENFTTNGVDVDTKTIDRSTIQFRAKGSIDPEFKLTVLGHFPTNTLQIDKSQWQFSNNGNWLSLLLWLPIICGSSFIFIGIFIIPILKLMRPARVIGTDRSCKVSIVQNGNSKNTNTSTRSDHRSGGSGGGGCGGCGGGG